MCRLIEHAAAASLVASARRAPDEIVLFAPATAAVPRRLPGAIRVRHVAVAEFVAQAGGIRAGDPEYARRRRPLRAGYSLGLLRRVGTLGLVVRRVEAPDRLCLLSSSHVLNSRLDGRPYAIYQPGGRDRETRDEPVAKASRFACPDRARDNVVEAGLAEPLPGVEVDTEHPLGPLRGVAAEVKPGQRLWKVGRTSGLACGEVIATDWRGIVRFRYGRFPYAGQLVIGSERPVSLDGDSGSVWITESGEVAAISFAGEAQGRLSIATPAAIVFSRLGITLAAPQEHAR